MINVDFEKETYTCPYCGHIQAFSGRHVVNKSGFAFFYGGIITGDEYASYIIHSFRCANKDCGKICVTSLNAETQEQFDILPQVTMNHYPEYIPEQIRKDYEEANLILERSPKAAATLLRRCLQGMIHDFWGIKERTLNEELTQLKGKVSLIQWQAIDGLRKIGNIGAHMEKDVNLIIDIEPDEAQKLLRLIEMLLEKWYITHHEEESLLSEIVGIAKNKEEQRK